MSSRTLAEPDPKWTHPVALPRTADESWANIQHTLDVYGDALDDDFVVIATSNIYGQSVRTGITWGDLRRAARDAGSRA